MSNRTKIKNQLPEDSAEVKAKIAEMKPGEFFCHGCEAIFPQKEMGNHGVLCFERKGKPHIVITDAN